MALHINLYEQHGRISPICETKLNIAKISEKSVIAARSVSLCSVHSTWFTFALHGVLSLWFAFRSKAQIIVDGKYIEWCRFNITPGSVRSNKNKKGNCVLGRMSCCSSLFQFDCIPVALSNLHLSWQLTCLTLTTLEHWRRSGFFIVNLKHTSHLVLVFLLLALSR